MRISSAPHRQVEHSGPAGAAMLRHSSLYVVSFVSPCYLLHYWSPFGHQDVKHLYRLSHNDDHLP